MERKMELLTVLDRRLGGLSSTGQTLLTSEVVEFISSEIDSLSIVVRTFSGTIYRCHVATEAMWFEFMGQLCKQGSQPRVDGDTFKEERA